MFSTKKVFVEMAELSRSAGIAATDQASFESVQSLPIPIVKNNKLNVMFLYCGSILRPPVPAKLTAPTFIVLMDAESGKLVNLKKVIPSDLGLADSPGTILGEFVMPEGVSGAEFQEKTNQLLTTYDQILPSFFKGKTSLDPKTKAAVKDFVKLFGLVGEPPLVSYYQTVGKDFFAWIKLVQN